MYRTGPLPAAIGVALALASCGGGGSSGGGTVGGGGPSGGGTTAGGSAQAGAAKAGGGARPTGAGGDETVGGGTRASGEAGGGATKGGVGGQTGGGGATKAGAAGKTGAAAGKGDCETQIGEFVDRMEDLRHALLAGLDYAEYVVRVRAIRDAYEAVPVDRLGASCLAGAAGAAEDAFNQYLRAANEWGECAGTAGCAASEIEGRLQRHWRTASKGLDEAEKG